MDLISGGLAGPTFLAAMAVAVFGGLVKGVVGFAMPTVMISLMASFLAYELALALLILPTLVTNVWQAFRGGLRAALATVPRYWRFIVTSVLLLFVSAQLVVVIPQELVYALLGIPVFIYAAVQLAGRPLQFDMKHRQRWEVILGAVSGFFGGLAGAWGPPLVTFLLSAGIEKRENIRVQGVVYLVGSVSLLLAHLKSGVLDATTVPLSLVMIGPAMLGLWLGFLLQDRLDQAAFRRWTLVVLAVAGLNLVRRALVV